MSVGTPRSRAACADVHRRLDAQAADPAVHHVLEQVAVVAGHLDHEGVGAEARAAPPHRRRRCARAPTQDVENEEKYAYSRERLLRA